MEGYQEVFKRIEKKYLITAEQYRALEPVLMSHMSIDGYGEHTISNIYYDADDYELIRKSLDKPVYKEKLRMRGYGDIKKDTEVFIEIKKKFKGIVYKRRVRMPLRQAEAFLSDGTLERAETQIHREIEYFCGMHCVKPKVYLAYDRVAMTDDEHNSLRVTFDRRIRFRLNKLTLDCSSEGIRVIEPDMALMELKTPDSIPMWLSRALSSLEIFPTSFSKYGCCYKEYICNDPQHESMERRTIYVA